MSNNKMFRCMECPAFYEVKREGLAATGGGWEMKAIEGREVLCCRPAVRVGGKRTMDQYCYYCLAKPTGKKIGSKASWTGRTPGWCPIGRDAKRRSEKV